MIKVITLILMVSKVSSNTITMTTLMVWQANFFQRVKFLPGVQVVVNGGPEHLEIDLLLQILKIAILYTKLTLLSNKEIFGCHLLLLCCTKEARIIFLRQISHHT